MYGIVFDGFGFIVAHNIWFVVLSASAERTKRTVIAGCCNILYAKCTVSEPLAQLQCKHISVKLSECVYPNDKCILKLRMSNTSDVQAIFNRLERALIPLTQRRWVSQYNCRLSHTHTHSQQTQIKHHQPKCESQHHNYNHIDIADGLEMNAYFCCIISFHSLSVFRSIQLCTYISKWHSMPQSIWIS